MPEVSTPAMSAGPVLPCRVTQRPRRRSRCRWGHSQLLSNSLRRRKESVTAEFSGLKPPVSVRRALNVNFTPSRAVLGRYSEDMSDQAVTPETLALRALLEARRSGFDALLVKYGATNPMLFGSVARGDAGEGSDIDILVEMDPVDGNILMRASGLLQETRELFGTDAVDIFPVQLLRRPVSESALAEAVAL